MSPQLSDVTRQLRARLTGRLASFRWRGALAAAAWVGLLGAMTFPVPPAGPTPGVDPQWILGLDLAARAHLQAGTEIVWPYGPLGFLGQPIYYFATQSIMAAGFLLVVHFGVFACVAVLFRRWGTAPWVWAVAGVAFLLPNFFGGYADREGLILVSLLFAVAADALKRPAWRGWLAAATLYSACLSLVVTTALVVAVADVVLFTTFALVRRQRQAAVAAPALFAGLLLLVWLASGQGLANIAAYVRSIYEILNWYPVTLALQPSPSWLVAGTATVLAVAFGALAMLVLRVQRVGTLLALSAPAVFVMFRDAFVRFDVPRIHMYLSILLVVCVVVAGAAASPGASAALGHVRGWGRGIAGACLVFGVLLVWGSMPATPFGSITADVRGLAHTGRLVVDTSLQRRAVAAAKQFFAGEIPLSSATVALLRTGTVEPVPWDVAAVYAYDLRWDPQPVMQSSEAFSSYLDHLDAAHLVGPQRPDFVLQSTQTIDGRYDPFDQPEVFRTLLNRYAPAEPPDGNQLVLRPRTTPTEQQDMTVSTTCGPFARHISVPSAPRRNIFADVGISVSPLGRALNSLFAPAWVTIVLDLSDGRTAVYRLAPGTASDGLFLSAYAPSAADLNRIFTGEATPSIVGFSLSTTAFADYAPDVCVRFWSQPAP